VDYQSFGATARLLALMSMFVTVVSNYWRHGDIDLTGRFANMRTLYGRSVLIGVVVAAVARVNVIAPLRNTPAFDSYLGFNGIDIVDDVIGILVTGAVLALLAKFWNDFFDILYEFKRFLRGKANALRPDDQPRSMREPRDSRDSRDSRDMRRGRRGSRGGRDRDADRFRDRDTRRPEPPREPSGGTV